jgi:hypothetical protein
MISRNHARSARKGAKSLRFNVFAPYAFLNLAPWREIIAHPNWVL